MPEIIEKIKDEVNEENKEKTKAKTSAEQIVHEHFICDGCGVNPIIGNRYKCAVCANFDLCSKC